MDYCDRKTVNPWCGYHITPLPCLKCIVSICSIPPSKFEPFCLWCRGKIHSRLQWRSLHIQVWAYLPVALIMPGVSCIGIRCLVPALCLRWYNEAVCVERAWFGARIRLQWRTGVSGHCSVRRSSHLPELCTARYPALFFCFPSFSFITEMMIRLLLNVSIRLLSCTIDHRFIKMYVSCVHVFVYVFCPLSLLDYRAL